MPSETPSIGPRRSKIFVTSDVALKICGCGEPILKGYSEGLITIVDPWPADRVTEIVALLQDRWTYTLIWFQLHRRTGSTPNGPVMIEHRCRRTLTRPALITDIDSSGDPDQPPF